MNPATPSTCYKIQVRLMCGSDIALGSGKAALLAAIATHGSISAAARQLGMSYRRAWLLVETMNRCFKTPVVMSNTGGRRGGGAQLTPLGQTVLTQYQTMMAAVEQCVSTHTSELSMLLVQPTEHLASPAIDESPYP